jgi:hypothetical protein
MLLDSPTFHTIEIASSALLRLQCQLVCEIPYKTAYNIIFMKVSPANYFVGLMGIVKLAKYTL